MSSTDFKDHIITSLEASENIVRKLFNTYIHTDLQCQLGYLERFSHINSEVALILKDSFDSKRDPACVIKLNEETVLVFVAAWQQAGRFRIFTMTTNSKTHEDLFRLVDEYSPLNYEKRTNQNYYFSIQNLEEFFKVIKFFNVELLEPTIFALNLFEEHVIWI